MEYTKVEFENGIFAAYCEIPSVLDIASDSRFGVTNVRQDNVHHQRFAVGCLLKELFGIDSVLKHLPSGAPYLEKDGKPLPPISISHCKGMGAVSSGDVVTGVDVETISDRVLRVRERVFSNEELRFIGTSVKLHTLAWTAKEAIFKVIPEEGVDFKEDIQLHLSAVSDDNKKNEYTATAYGREYKLTTMNVGDDKLLTVAYECK